MKDPAVQRTTGYEPVPERERQQVTSPYQRERDIYNRLRALSWVDFRSKNENRVKDCPVGYQLRILVINVSAVPDRPKPP
jgi:hypothetical protein